MSEAMAQSCQRHVRLLLRQRQPELAAQLNTVVRTMACGPRCRLHPNGRNLGEAFLAIDPGPVLSGVRIVTGPQPAQDSPGQPSGA